MPDSRETAPERGAPERILVGWDRYGDETWWGPDYILNGEEPVYVPEARLKAVEAERDTLRARAETAEAALAVALAEAARAREALAAAAQHDASNFWGADAEKNRRASWRGVMRKVRAAIRATDTDGAERGVERG